MNPTLSTRREQYEEDFPLHTHVPTENPSFDLKDGFSDRYVKRDESVDEKLDHILKWIISNRTDFTLDVDFVTLRGHLTKLLTTPYEDKEGWMFAVTKFRGTIYIDKVETEAARRDRDNRTERHSEMMYWGYKFEQYMCADNIESLPDPSGVVNTNEGYYTVVRTQIAEHKLLFSAEVDCRVREPKDPPSCYVELKTSAEIRTPLKRSDKFKLLKWWAQSFMPGVPQVVAGFRDRDGIVVKVETFQTAEMSQLVEGENNCWKPTVCMNFCNDFLTFVKDVVSEDDPSVVYLFSWEPRRDVGFTIHRDSQYGFLPEWYINEITRTDT
uniref:Decapping nuclease n=1 Tax=Knipowitschia caucasica TaxID=637954 RepID=A0AAV2KLK7_KNICA